MKMFKFLFTVWMALAAVTATAQDIPKWKVNQLDSIIQKAEKPTIINFWATFCVPCIEELPYFQKAAQQWDSAGLELVLVSLDLDDAYPKKIKDFTKRFKITAPVAFLDETNADLFCPVVDKSWSGAIPATLFINNKTGYRHFVEDQLTEAQLQQEIKKLLAPALK